MVDESQNQKRDGLSAIEMAKQQLGKIIDFAPTKSTISKNLKMALLPFRKLVDDAKQDHEHFVKTAAAAEPTKAKVTKSTKTEALKRIRFRKKPKWRLRLLLIS